MASERCKQDHPCFPFIFSPSNQRQSVLNQAYKQHHLRLIRWNIGTRYSPPKATKPFIPFHAPSPQTIGHRGTVLSHLCTQRGFPDELTACLEASQLSAPQAIRPIFALLRSTTRIPMHYELACGVSYERTNRSLSARQILRSSRRLYGSLSPPNSSKCSLFPPPSPSFPPLRFTLTQ